MPLQTLLLTLLLLSISPVMKRSPAFAIPFSPPPERGAPNSTAGGGSRLTTANCTFGAQSGQSAIALVPQSFVGLTHQPNPSLWFYVPANEAEIIEVSVFDKQLNGLVQFEVSTLGDVGPVGSVQSVDLSEHITLSAEVPYYWTAAFVCDRDRRTEDWIVGGWIQYQPMVPRERQALLALSPIEQIDQYTSIGYWYDALDVVMLLSQTTSPASMLRPTWNRLIQQATIDLSWNDLNNATRSLDQ